MILTPGSKKRLLDKLLHLIDCVDNDLERETIMFYSSEIMPCVVSQLNYYEPEKKEARRRSGKK